MKNLGRSFSPLPILMAVIAALQPDEPTRKVKISTHEIEQKKEVAQLSKRKLQRMKGKKARKNRGGNRSQDTALYATLRR